MDLDTWLNHTERNREESSQNLALNPSGLSGTELARARQRLFVEGSSFKAAHRDQIVGIEGALQQIDEIIDALVHAEIYASHGARLEPGILLSGTPGTGKTTSARYIATASDAKFVNVRDWPHEHPLPTDADIRELFTYARALYRQDGRPIILFWDEFEGVAVNRADASPEIAAVVSQLTSELDGVAGKNTGILLIGCTNYSHQIDPALKRAGRMGIEIEFGPPDAAGKAALLDHYLSGYTHGSVDTSALALCFRPHACAAEIEEACQHAWRYAVARSIRTDEAPRLDEQDLQHVFLERLIGPPANYITMSDEERLWIAVHELGHALVAMGVGTPVSLITVRAGEHALGKVISRSRREHTKTLNDLRREIAFCFGGIAAQELCRMPKTTGAEGDIVAANDSALELVEDHAWSEGLGWMTISNLADERGHNRHPDIHPDNIKTADDAIHELLDLGYTAAERVLADIGEDNLRIMAEWMLGEITVTGHVLIDKLEELTGHHIEVLDEYLPD